MVSSHAVSVRACTFCLELRTRDRVRLNAECRHAQLVKKKTQICTAAHPPPTRSRQASEKSGCVFFFHRAGAAASTCCLDSPLSRSAVCPTLVTASRIAHKQCALAKRTLFVRGVGCYAEEAGSGSFLPRHMSDKIAGGYFWIYILMARGVRFPLFSLARRSPCSRLDSS